MYNVQKYDNLRIKQARTEKRWSRLRLAELASVHETTVYRLEKLGQGRIENVGRIVDVLGLEMRDVVVGQLPEDEPVGAGK